MMQNNENAAAMNAIRRITWIGVIANLLLTGLKFAAGIWGHSSVIIADAVHSLSDLVTDAAVLLGMRFWNRPADQEHPYGHAKVETLVTLFIGAALAMVGIDILCEAVRSLFRILEGAEIPSPTWIPLVAALISIVVKEWLFRITVNVGKAAKSSATIANAFHHRSDALSSIPAALSIGACLLFGNQYTFLDPVGAVVVSMMIVLSAWEIARPAFAVLLDSGASKAQCEAISEMIRAFDEVWGLHKLRTRQVGAAGLALDVHIQVDPQMFLTDAHALSHRIQRRLLRSDENIIDVFVHMEPCSPEHEAESLCDNNS